MLAIFLDVQNEILDISREFEVMQRKVQRFESAENIEDKDSHVRAIAGCVHGIFGGMEKILKDLINHIDGVLPTGDDWHIQLLRRAKYANEGVRPAIISEATFSHSTPLEASGMSLGEDTTRTSSLRSSWRGRMRL